MMARTNLKLQLILIIINFAITSSSNFNSNQEKFQTYTSVDTKKPYHQILIHPVTKDVYIGGTNEILHLTSNLTLITRSSVGPEKDNLQCPPSPQQCDFEKELTDNEVKILLLNDDNTKLIYCGTINQGLCDVTDYNAISTRVTTVGDERNPVNYISGKKSVFAYFSNGVTGRSLYTALTYDGRPFEFMPYEVSSRRLVAQGTKYRWEYTVYIENDHLTATGVKFREEYKPSYIVNYVHGFTYKNFSYFVTTQKVSLKSSEYESRLVRVHKFDNKFFSYTEVPISCSKKDEGTYKFASAAYLGPARPQVLLKSEYPTDKDALYVSFIRVTSSQQKFDPKHGSITCLFPVTQIVDSFTSTTKRCFGTDRDLQLIPWIVGPGKYCKSYSINIDDDFRGSGFNTYIEGKIPINGIQLYNSPHHVTSLSVIVQNDKIVGFLGTSDGDLFKILLKPQGASQELLRISVAPELDSNLKAVSKTKAFDDREKNLYILTGNKVTKVPVASCKLYPSCHACMTSHLEPLNCGWCENHCSLKEECTNVTKFTKNTCPPVIDRFSPTQGPLEGGTNITIEGNYFGSQNSAGRAQINVYIGLETCQVLEWNMEKIMCRTMKVTSPRENVIKVEVNDPSRLSASYEIYGQTLSYGKIFSFVIPKVIDFEPKYGPHSGGTNITIYGEHLLAGSSKYIWVAGIICKEYNLTAKAIHCTTGIMNYNENDKAIRCTTESKQYNESNNAIHCISGLMAPQSSSNIAPIAGPIIIDIDGTAFKVFDSVGNEKLFTYKPNPVVDKIFPKTSIKSGGAILNISGNYLDSVANPRMVITPVVHQRPDVLEFEGRCKVISQFKMICVTPNLSTIPYQPDSKAPLITYISFIMDGVTTLRELPQKNQMLSRFLYYPDPVYFEFPNADKVKEIGVDEKLLRIEGENLNLAQSINDVKVQLHINRTCEVQELSETHLLCKLPHSLDYSAGNKFKVEILSGNLSYTVGYIQFTSYTSTNFLIVPLAVTIPLLLLLAFVIIGFLWRHHITKLRKTELAVQYRANSQEDLELAARTHPNQNYGTNDYHTVNGKSSRRGGECGLIHEETRRLLEAENILMSPENLEIGEIIGQGHFGCVYHGILRLPGKEIESDVAVKTINQDHSGDFDVEAFLNEGLMMKDFHHINVLTLVGVCFQNDGKPIVIIPYMKNGDLLSYIRSEDNHPSVKDLITFGIQIAEGMKYLSELKFVHRDLAARNCMLDEDLTVKVADFGLSRDIYESAYYSSENKKTKLPVKWMAPESLEKGQYSIKSDVWSYGVVLWELLTRGICPYPEVDNWDVVRFLKLGRRMPQPCHCPNMLYQIMRRCWLEDSHQRPTFSELVDEINELVRKLEYNSRHRKVGLNVTYVNHPVNSDENSDLPEVEGAEAIVV